MRVSYTFGMNRGWFEEPPNWDELDLCSKGQLVVGHFIGMKGTPWQGTVRSAHQTPAGFEFDAENNRQHFAVVCNIGGPW